MNTKIIVGIIVIAVLGGGVYMLMRNRATSEAMRSDESSAMGDDSETFSGSISDLSKRGGSWMCTVDSSTAQAATTGTVYVSGKNVRAEFAVDVQGYGKINAYMIADGEYTYSWSSMTPQGVKAKMTSEGEGGAATSGQGVDANSKYAYHCELWTADASKFTVPTNVTFRAI